MPGYKVVLAPQAIDALARIADPTVLAAIVRTIENDLAPLPSERVMEWRAFPLVLYVAVPYSVPLQDTLLADPVPDEEPVDELDLQWFVFFEHLTDRQRRDLPEFGYPDYLIAFIKQL